MEEKTSNLKEKIAELKIQQMIELHKEYEKYMKKVCENFVAMQARSCVYKGKEYCPFAVYWDGHSIDWIPMSWEEYVIKTFPKTENDGIDNVREAELYLKYMTCTFAEYIKDKI